MPSKQDTTKPKKKPAAKKAPAKKAPVKKAAPKQGATSKKSAAKSQGKKGVTGGTRSKPKSRSTSRRSPAKGQTGGASGGPGRFFAILSFVMVAVALGIGVYAWIQATPPRPPDKRHAAPQAELPRKTKQFGKAENTAIPPTPETKGTAAPLPSSAPELALPDNRPLAAIIIDDIGDNKAIAEKFFSLEAAFTYAILPHTRHTREIAEAAIRRGYQVMLHLPMEPNEYPEIDPGPGSLLTLMTPDERIRQLKINLAAVPQAQGVNNHMGSKMTAMSDQMNQIFTVLKKRDLFFIDSRTTAATQCRSSARLFNIAFAERDVFLDHVPRREAIFQKIEELVQVAEISGCAVAIGHPHQSTYEVLREALPQINQRLRLVPASALAKTF